VGAVLAEQADPTIGITKGDKILTQKPDTHRRAIWTGNFFR
jgi:hypothetical protein